MGCPVLFLVQKEREREKKTLWRWYLYVTLLLEVRHLESQLRGTCRVAKCLMNGSEASIVKGVI